MAHRSKKLRGKKRRMRNPEAFIPAGSYCYTRQTDGKLVRCPFLRFDKNSHHQENGICEAFRIRDKDTGGLLWDMVKECGIKDDLSLEELREIEALRA